MKRSGTTQFAPGRRASALLLGAVVLLSAGLAVGCGGNEREGEAKEDAREEPVSAPNPNAKPVDPATAGTISGVIKLDGAPPKMRPINLRSVPSCNQMHATPLMTEDVVAGDNGALQNVVVYLKGDFSSYTFPENTEEAKIDQHGCVYIPHVVAVTTHNPIQIHNSDSATHNSSAATKVNRSWNETQTVGGAPVERTFARPEIGISLKCNLHPWMKVYVSVFDHPYFQVTGKDGSFTLKNVPPGNYTIAAWQERYGTVEQPVTVTSGGAQNVTLNFKAE